MINTRAEKLQKCCDESAFRHEDVKLGYQSKEIATIVTDHVTYSATCLTFWLKDLIVFEIGIEHIWYFEKKRNMLMLEPLS